MRKFAEYHFNKITGKNLGKKDVFIINLIIKGYRNWISSIGV
jgi:hypothetical protein